MPCGKVRSKGQSYNDERFHLSIHTSYWLTDGQSNPKRAHQHTRKVNRSTCTICRIYPISFSMSWVGLSICITERVCEREDLQRMETDAGKDGLSAMSVTRCFDDRAAV